MADEFGIQNGNIACAGVFIPAMRELCGQRFTIKGIRRVTSSDCVWLSSVEQVESTSKMFRGYYAITYDMLELDDTDDFTPVSADTLFDFWRSE